MELQFQTFRETPYKVSHKLLPGKSVPSWRIHDKNKQKTPTVLLPYPIILCTYTKKTRWMELTDHTPLKASCWANQQLPSSAAINAIHERGFACVQKLKRDQGQALLRAQCDPKRTPRRKSSRDFAASFVDLNVRRFIFS